jgi:hypothetical protein
MLMGLWRLYKSGGMYSFGSSNVCGIISNLKENEYFYFKILGKSTSGWY